MKRTKIALKREQIRHLSTAQLGKANGGLQCTQSCNQCSLYPECGGDTSSTTFAARPTE